MNAFSHFKFVHATLKLLEIMTVFGISFPQVKAWHACKDAEALRLQKLLVEEEEAAQKRYTTKNSIEFTDSAFPFK